MTMRQLFAVAAIGGAATVLLGAFALDAGEAIKVLAVGLIFAALAAIT